MKKFLAFALVAMIAGSAFAAGGWWNEYIELSINGGASTQYQLGTGGTGIALDGANLSSALFSLTLTDVSINYWNDTQDRTGGNLFWQIFDGVSPTPVTSSSIAWTQTAQGGNDYIGEWSGTQNILGAASYNDSQTYYVQFWANNEGTTDGTYWLNNGNDPENYQASFTYDAPAIPEPATMSLLGLGALAMVLRRKIRK